MAEHCDKFLKAFRRTDSRMTSGYPI
jgi:hypothetical protein